jgi:hypothetical protein
MLKIIRCILYGLAITTGIAGLIIGGNPPAKYLWEMLRDSEYRNYYDTHNLNEPEMIFLLSLILLIGVRICLALDKGNRPANPAEAVPSGKKPVAPAPANEISPPTVPPETPAQPVESADKKLTRLLHQKRD